MDGRRGKREGRGGHEGDDESERGPDGGRQQRHQGTKRADSSDSRAPMEETHRPATTQRQQISAAAEEKINQQRQWVALRARAGETDGGSTGHATGSTLLQRTRPRKVLACRAAAGALLGPRPALCAFERCPLRITHTFSVCWQLHSFPQACSCQPGTVPSPTVTGADEPPRRATYGGAGVAHQGEGDTGERG